MLTFSSPVLGSVDGSALFAPSHITCRFATGVQSSTRSVTAGFVSSIFVSCPRDLCESDGSDSDLCTLFFQEKYVYDLKMKNQELQNFKFVLSYKIEEFKKQIESRENDIETMKKHIGEVSNSLIWPLLLSPLSKYKNDQPNKSMKDSTLVVLWLLSRIHTTDSISVQLIKISVDDS